MRKNKGGVGETVSHQPYITRCYKPLFDWWYDMSGKTEQKSERDTCQANRPAAVKM